MKVKFPILIKGVHQFNKLMDYLKEHNIVWADGDELTNYNDFCKSEGFVNLPIRIFYIPHSFSWAGCNGAIYYKELNENWNPKEVEVEF